MTIIVDASVAVKWVVPEAGSDEAAKLLEQEDVAAPAFWLAEAANALWAKAARGEASEEEARERAQALAIARWRRSPSRCCCPLPWTLRWS